MSVKAIVFENLQRWHLPVARWYRWRRYDVYYLNTSLGESTELEESAGRIRRLELEEPLYFNNDPASDHAFQAIETVYQEMYPQWSAAVNSIATMYDSEDVHLAFKKNLLFDLTDYFHVRLLMSRIHRLLPDARKLKFVPDKVTAAVRPSRYDSVLRNASEIVPAPAGPVRIPFWMRLVGAKTVVRQNLRLAAVCAHTILNTSYWLLRSRGRKIERLNYRLGVTIYSPTRQFSNDVRGLDFLLDNEEFREDNTLFVPLPAVSIQDHHRQHINSRGLSLADLTPAPSPSIWQRVQWHGAQALARLFFLPGWAANTNVYMIRNYWIWSCFQRRYKIEQLVSAADTDISHIARNILLKQDGVDTWYYLDTENLGALYLNDGRTPPHLHPNWGYLFYDNCVAWSPRLVKYYRSHKQKIDNYFAVGCLWSKHISQLRDGEISSGLLDQLHAAGYSPGQKLVAVFDSTYVNISRTTYQDGVEFAQAIERLIENQPDIFVVWKEKKYRQDHPQGGTHGLISIYDRLADHPRCFFTGTDASTAEVSAACDVTISFPFTSTTLEALGAGVKAIYYVPNDKFHGSVFEQAPRLVAHDPDELEEIVETLLHHTTDNEYQKYLHQYVKGELELHLDGEALSRFRKLVRDRGELPAEVGRNGNLVSQGSLPESPDRSRTISK